ncbi:unnamed protein product [Candida verbasci]|uniref:1,3-beta-glucanosyltransferase n=1 Tax=Candida verbasci TaxID=1227364 RepID=A0A9W4XBN0_9ASCO|nr:unnamed protein product [Candida verbasci]
MISYIIRLLISFSFLTYIVDADVHPIVIHGHFFIDNVTKEPFYVKGIDYQPGGSSGFSPDKDPLSDPAQCARDIVLFQELGINTVRIYSINSQLNHDKCMTMLAKAGIYLVLDVNSPMPQHHLNRYEPWTTYNLYYLENIFKIVEQFSWYNNTLAFIAGNEIVNDPISASVSAPYIKAVVRDLKLYISKHSPRQVPVGYSAADDLNYRISLAKYLECYYDDVNEAIDFYGVNSYQWCGDQTFYSSGYSILVNDYKSFTKPVFFTEYGCNEVLPRNFDEVPILYTNDMIDVFQGGLIYEFSQEPNNYGLVEVLPDGDINILRDFLQLKTKYDSLPNLDYNFILESMKVNAQEINEKIRKYKTSVPRCDERYLNLDISKGVPASFGEILIDCGVSATRGKYVDLSTQEMTSQFRYYLNGEPFDISPVIDTIFEFSAGDVERRQEVETKEKEDNAFKTMVHKVSDSIKSFCNNLFN